MYSVTLLLKLIPHDTPLTWREFVAPFEEEGPLDPFERAALQLQVEALAMLDLVTITRRPRQPTREDTLLRRMPDTTKLHSADTLQLTELGAERARESLKGEGYVYTGRQSEI